MENFSKFRCETIRDGPHLRVPTHLMTRLSSWPIGVQAPVNWSSADRYRSTYYKQVIVRQTVQLPYCKLLTPRSKRKGPLQRTGTVHCLNDWLYSVQPWSSFLLLALSCCTKRSDSGTHTGHKFQLFAGNTLHFKDASQRSDQTIASYTSQIVFHESALCYATLF